MIIRMIILAELCTEDLSIDTHNRYELARVVRKPGGVKQAAHLDEMLLGPDEATAKEGYLHFSVMRAKPRLLGLPSCWASSSSRSASAAAVR
jgi:hypothetical protein